METTGIRQHVRRVLTSGTMHAVEESNRLAGFNGVLKTGMVAITGEGPAVKAVVKDHWAQAIQERWIRRMAEQLGIERWYPDVRLRRDGTAFIEFVQGDRGFAGRIKGSPDGIRMVMEEILRSEMPVVEAANRARRDSQLVLFLDYLVANSDRRQPNVLVEPGKNLNFIDNGLMGRADLPEGFMNMKSFGGSPLAPALDDSYFGGGRSDYAEYVFKLDDDVVEHIRTRLPKERLNFMHSVLQRLHTPPMVGDPRLERNERVNAAVLAWTRTDEFLANMHARLDYALAHGKFHWKWTSPEAG